MFNFLFELNSITTESSRTAKLSFASVFLTYYKHEHKPPFQLTVCSVNYSCEIEFTIGVNCVASAYFHVSRAIRIQFSELYEITNYLIFSLRFVVLFLGFFLKIAQLFSGSLCTLSQIDWHFDDSRDFFFSVI